MPVGTATPITMATMEVTMVVIIKDEEEEAIDNTSNTMVMVMVMAMEGMGTPTTTIIINLDTISIIVTMADTINRIITAMTTVKCNTTITIKITMHGTITAHKGTTIDNAVDSEITEEIEERDGVAVITNSIIIGINGISINDDNINISLKTLDLMHCLIPMTMTMGMEM